MILNAIEKENKMKKFKETTAKQRMKVQELKKEDIDLEAAQPGEAAQPEEPPKSVGRLTE